VNTVYAYPWDIQGDPGAAERLRGLGTPAVALAASYHTVRAATPHHPRHRMVQAHHAASYVPLRPEVWESSRLTPGVPDWVDGEDSFGQARDALREAGLAVHAWTVLTHNSRLGAAHPDLTVRNAFGDHYPYALCPAAEDVADYCERLVGEVMELGAPDGIILEACGPLGARHGSHHEKTDGAEWSPVQLDLLSLSFSKASRELYRQAGLDPEELAGRVRAAVDAEQPPDSVDSALGSFAEPVRRVRTGIVASLRRRLVARARAVRADVRISMHATADPWATGPFATVADGAQDVDCLVGNCWGAPEASEAGLQALRGIAPQATSVGAYVLALPPSSADPADLSAQLDRYAAAGAQEFHLYHGGLASGRRLDAITRALAARSDNE
jgi:hypothetical protein